MRQTYRAAVLSILTIAIASYIDAADFEYFSATQLRDLLGASASPEPQGLSHRFGEHGTYHFFAIRRDRSGEAEVHRDWDDIFIVREGFANMLLGGEVAGAREVSPGETRGSEIRGGKTQQISAGDILIIPAGMPHQVQLGAGHSLVYFVVKVQPSRPK
jgi:mannose-6-phosphate isomerase-like protein (cupin superfamily)